MVHLRCYHTRIEDAESSYSVSRLKDMMEDTDHDLAAIDKLRTAIRMRLAALENVDFYELVVIKQSRDYGHNNRIVFYVSRDLFARAGDKEIYVEGHDHKSFLWKERKSAFSYAEELSKTHSLQIRDLTEKKKPKGGELIAT